MVAEELIDILEQALEMPGCIQTKCPLGQTTRVTVTSDFDVICSEPTERKSLTKDQLRERIQEYEQR